MKLLCIVPGFGNPFLDSKLQILERNMKYISRYPGLIDLVICVYDNSNVDQLKFNQIDNVNISIHYEKGIVGEFLIKYTNHDIIENYSHIMILLDDIELQPSFKWDLIFTMINDFNLDIFSPCLTKDSKYIYDYMIKSNEKYTLNIVNCCELFCYIIPSEKYAKYFKLINNMNPWMWGVDLILNKIGNLQVGLSNVIQMRHYFQLISPNHKELRYKEMTNYLKIYNLSHHELIDLNWSRYSIFKS